MSRTKGITYLKADSVKGIREQQLNVFAPHDKANLKEVLIFVHGGNWNSGKRSLYNFLGNRMARKGVVMVVIDYPLSPTADWLAMTQASATAVNWVKENIFRYGGDPKRIFISGHSAGGHIAALLTTDNQFWGSRPNPLKGAILIDAAGLDMYRYLLDESFPVGHTYLQTFTDKPATWKAASPLYHLHNDMPPMLIYSGGKTYPSIKTSNERFVQATRQYAPETAWHILQGKKHVPMITQFFYTGNPRYKEMLKFMREQP